MQPLTRHPWNKWTSHVKHPCGIAQNVVRLVFGACRLDHTSMLFYRCRVLRFKDLVKLKMCSILYKVNYNMPVPANVNCLFIKNTHVRSSRIQRQYVLLSIRTNIKARL